VETLVRRSCSVRKGFTAPGRPGGNKASKLKAIREAPRTAKRVWLATDCDREGQLIGQEILEHYTYRGEVMRVLFTAQDSQSIRDAFGRAKPNSEYSRLYAAAVARRQADQIYNLSLTRTATVILGRGVIGVGRVKTPTLAIVCKRELEIRDFVPVTYFEIVATANVAAGEFQMRHAPQDRIIKRENADIVVKAAQGFHGPLGVRVEDKKQGPPKLHDLPSLQKLCSSRFDDVVVGKQEMVGAVDAVCDVTQRIIGKLKDGAQTGGAPLLRSGFGGAAGDRPPTPAMKRLAVTISRQKRVKLPAGYATSGSICRTFLQHVPEERTRR
jgi:hypothetical protein